MALGAVRHLLSYEAVADLIKANKTGAVYLDVKLGKRTCTFKLDRKEVLSEMASLAGATGKIRVVEVKYANYHSDIYLSGPGSAKERG